MWLPHHVFKVQNLKAEHKSRGWEEKRRTAGLEKWKWDVFLLKWVVIYQFLSCPVEESFVRYRSDRLHKVLGRPSMKPRNFMVLRRKGRCPCKRTPVSSMPGTGQTLALPQTTLQRFGINGPRRLMLGFCLHTKPWGLPPLYIGTNTDKRVQDCSRLALCHYTINAGQENSGAGKAHIALCRPCIPSIMP